MYSGVFNSVSLTRDLLDPCPFFSPLMFCIGKVKYSWVPLTILHPLFSEKEVKMVE